MLRLLKECDIFRKVPSEYREAAEAQETGPITNAISLALIVFLAVSETRSFLTPIARQRFDIDMQSSVDASTPRKLRVVPNVTIHDFPCIDLSLDYQDVMGTRAVDVRTTIFKQRLHPNGSFVGEIVKNNPKEATVSGGASN